MPTITIETHTLSPRQFQLVRSVRIGAGALDEFIDEKESDSRLTAVIINVGMACRYLVDKYPDYNHKLVEIVSDVDGKDVRYDGEQDTIYHLINPRSDAESRKLQGMYSRYDRFLDRIRELTRKGRIRFELVGND